MLSNQARLNSLRLNLSLLTKTGKRETRLMTRSFFFVSHLLEEGNVEAVFTVLFIDVLDFSFFFLLLHLPPFEQLFDLLVELLLFLLLLTDLVRLALKLVFLSVDVVLNVFQLFGAVDCAQMLSHLLRRRSTRF